jgi:GAF domain-containing protein/HAMP domain-containing protein
MSSTASTISPRQLPVVRRIVRNISALGFLTAAGMLLQSFLIPAPLLLVTAGGLVGMALLALLAWRLVRAGRAILGGGLLVASLFLGMLFCELTLAGVTPYLLGFGILITWSTTRATLGKRWYLPLGLALGYAAVELAALRLSPFSEFDITQSQAVQLTMIAPLGLGLLAAAYTTFQTIQLKSIRYRLLLAFITITVLPLVVTGIFSSLINTRNTEDRVVNQLESVVTLKEAEIDSWLNTLDLTLDTLVVDEDRDLLVTVMLKPDVTPDLIYSLYHDRMLAKITRAMERVRMFDEVFIMDANGRVVLSTDANQEGKSFRGQPVFEEGLRGHYISPPLFAPSLNSYRVVVVLPLYNATGQIVGVLAGRASMHQLDGIMQERAGLGETGETYLVGSNNVLITSLRGGEQYRIMRTTAVDEAIARRRNGALVSYDNTFGLPVIGVYHWLDQLGVAIIAEQERSEALQSIGESLAVLLWIMAGSLVGAIFLALLVTRSIANPISELAQITGKMAAGNLDLQVELNRSDEVGDLAEAFKSMAAQLRAVFAGLEERVAERTRELERRSTQLQVASEVARDITTAKNLDDLLKEAVNLIRERFSFYHAGIFLVDEQGEFAVLRAATGDAGREMLKREHQLKVGAVGLVGYVTGTGRLRMAQDVGDDIVHFKNPLLPETRSELALPLRVGASIIGALDVQSTQPAAFSQEDLTVLQTLADQLAVAIENTRLLNRMNESVRELEQAYGEYTRQSWHTYTRAARRIRGYRYRRLDVEAARDQHPEARQALHQGQVVEAQLTSASTGSDPDPAAEAAASRSALAVPIRLRDEVIGVLNLRFASQSVPHESRLLAEEIAGRLALVLENSRLLQEAQRLALREQQINLIATEVRGSVNLETILQTTVRELGKALGADRTYIQVGEGGWLAGEARAQAGNGNGAQHPDRGLEGEQDGAGDGH